MSDNRVLVVGATGQTGRAATTALLAISKSVRVLVRSEAKGRRFSDLGCDVHIGDVLDPNAVRRAVAGVAGIAACLGAGHDPKSDPPIERIEIDGNGYLIDAAAASEAKPHLVYVSSLNIEQAAYARPWAVKLDTEARLKESGVPHTIVRPSNLTESITGDFVRNGVAYLAGRFKKPTSPISTHDVGAIIARCFDLPEARGQTYELFGPEAVRFPDVIRRWHAVTGDPVKFRWMPLFAFRLFASMTKGGSPMMPAIYTLVRAFNQLDWSGDPAQTRQLRGHDLLTIEKAAERSKPANAARAAAGRTRG